MRLASKGFVLPLVLFFMNLIFVLCFFLFQNLHMSSVLALSYIEHNKIESGIQEGEKILIDLLNTYPYPQIKNQIGNSPKIYLNSQVNLDSNLLIVYSFINKSSTQIVFVMTVYLLKTDQIGLTFHPVMKKPLSSGSYRTCYQVSNQYVQSSRASYQYSFSVQESDYGKLVSKELININYFD